jgi:hypothetical protein
MTIQLDDYEQDILDSVERGEWQSVPNLQQEIDRYQSHAIAFMKSQINAGDKAMLKTYEAIIRDKQVNLSEMAGTEPDAKNIPRRRFPIASLAGKVKILGDIVRPIVDEEDWECLK